MVVGVVCFCAGVESGRDYKERVSRKDVGGVKRKPSPHKSTSLVWLVYRGRRGVEELP